MAITSLHTDLGSRTIAEVAGVTNHNDLANIDGGTSGENYHVTSAQHADLTTKAYGGFFAYNKTIPFNITVADTYHALYQVTAANLTQGLLSNFTFNAGRLVDGNIVAATDNAGKVQIECSGNHSLVDGDLVVLGFMNGATASIYNKPTLITKVNDTTFTCNNIPWTGAAVGTSGTVTKPAYLKAGDDAAGVYNASFVLDGTAAQTNKNWKWELNTNITANDNIVSERNSTNSLASMCSIGNITIAAKDKIWISGKNLSDTSDYTIKNMNLNLHKL